MPAPLAQLLLSYTSNFPCRLWMPFIVCILAVFRDERWGVRTQTHNFRIPRDAWIGRDLHFSQGYYNSYMIEKEKNNITTTLHAPVAGDKTVDWGLGALLYVKTIIFLHPFPPPSLFLILSPLPPSLPAFRYSFSHTKSFVSENWIKLETNRNLHSTPFPTFQTQSFFIFLN